jgi:hypothetical protein
LSPVIPIDLRVGANVVTFVQPAADEAPNVDFMQVFQRESYIES